MVSYRNIGQSYVPGIRINSKKLSAARRPSMTGREPSIHSIIHLQIVSKLNYYNNNSELSFKFYKAYLCKMAIRHLAGISISAGDMDKRMEDRRRETESLVRTDNNSSCQKSKSKIKA
jgi:hypothetical protein